MSLIAHPSRHLVTLFFALLALAGPVACGATGFDHSAFDALLKRSVRDGAVDYDIFRNSPPFRGYLKALSEARPATLATDERLAFWINGYNALTIANVLDNPGMKKPIDVAGFFDRKTFRVAGRSLTLNQIENDIIRPEFKEPLIHFGLVCAAVNCPPLIDHAYTGANVRARLAENARNYLASTYNRYDAKRNRLQLAKIFEWYAVDFGGESGVRTFVKRYGTDSMKTGVNGRTKITYLEYDWRLNDR